MRLRLKILPIWLLIIIAIMAIVLPNHVFATDAWYNSSWAYRMKITFSGNNFSGNENMTDFPVLVKLTTTNFTFAHANSGGTDIRFTDSDGTTLLKYEIEQWTNSTSAYIWVKVPQMDSGASDYIYMYYGYASATDAQDAPNVWNSGYLAVYHMNDVTDTSHIKDSTGNGLNMTKVGAANPAVTSSGKMGYAETYNGSTSGSYTGATSTFHVTTAMTQEEWLKPSNVTANVQTPVHMDSIGNYGYGMNANQGSGGGAQSGSVLGNIYTNTGITAFNGTGLLVNGTYVYLAHTYDKSNYKVYVNGAYVTQTAETHDITYSASTVVLWAGETGSNYYFPADIDEIRVSNTARDAAWLKASYVSETDAMNTYGGEQGGALPTVSNSAATSIAGTTATLNGNMTADGNAQCTNQGFAWGTTSQSTPSSSTAPSASAYSNNYSAAGTYSTGTFNHGVTGLSSGTVYYDRAAAYNPFGWGWGSTEDSFLTIPDAPTALTPTAGDTQVAFTWTNATGGGGVTFNTRVNYKTGSYPSSYNDGTATTGIDWTSNSSGTITSLTNGTTYYFAAWTRAVSGGLTQYSTTSSQTTATPQTAGVAPVVISDIVGGFGKDWVILRGRISDDKSQTINNVGFECGLTTSYGTSVNETVALHTNDYFTMTIRNLTPATVYHWRAFATYSGSATGDGADAYFSTKGSPVLEEYLDTGGNSDTAAIDGLNLGAMQFTTTTNAHTVTNVRVMLKRVGSPGTVNLSIRHGSSSLPTGQDTITFTSVNGNNFSTSYAWVNFTIDPNSPYQSMTGGSQYAVVISALNGDGSNYVLWQIVSGGALSNAVASHSTDGGISWTSDTPKDALFEVWGNPAFQVISGAEFDNYLTTGDMLFTMEYVNIYPDLTTVTDASRYFNCLLVSANDGTTILAATPMPLWGDKPASIYLSPSVASSITKGSGVYLELLSSSLNVYTAYQLTGSDWHGSNLTYLDKWVLATADSIDNYYGFSGTTSLTKYIAGKGQVLSSSTLGAAIFITGIPALDSVRGNLFETVVQTPDSSPLATKSDTFNNETTWDSVTGSKVSSDFTTFGSLIGLDGKSMLGTALLLLAVAFAVFGMIAAGTGLSPVAFLVAIPLLFWGANIRAIDINVIMLISIILAALAARKIFWSEG